MILKSLAAIYFALYLVIPSCLCQLLGAFGIVLEEPRSGHFVIEAAPEFTVACHCGEHVVKDVEFPATEPAVLAPGSEVTGKAPLIVEAALLPSPHGATNWRAPPPPDRLPVFALSPQVSCVFLL